VKSQACLLELFRTKETTVEDELVRALSSVSKIYEVKAGISVIIARFLLEQEWTEKEINVIIESGFFLKKL
jgi:hypothetical protein